VLKVGIIGSTEHSQEITTAFQQLSGKFRLIGNFDASNFTPSEEEKLSLRTFIQKTDCLFFSDEKSSTISNILLAVKALKPIFIHSPQLLKSTDIKSLLKVAEEANVKIQLENKWWFHPAFLAVREEINRPSFIELKQNFKTSVAFPSNLIFSALNTVQLLAKSKIKKSSASVHSIANLTIDVVNIQLEFENGCVANVQLSQLPLDAENKLTIYQKGKTFSLDFLKNDVFHSDFEIRNSNRKTIISEEKSILNELSNFYQNILSDKNPVVSFEDGIETLNLANKIKERFQQFSYSL